MAVYVCLTAPVKPVLDIVEYYELVIQLSMECEENGCNAGREQEMGRGEEKVM